MEIKELKFYRLNNTINKIYGLMTIEIPVKKETLLSLEKDNKLRRSTLGYKYDIKFPSLKFWDSDKEDYVEIIVYFYIGNIYYKEVTDKCLLNRLIYGKDTILNETNFDNYYKHCIYYERYPKIDIQWEEFFTNIITNNRNKASSLIQINGRYITNLMKLLETLNSEIEKK